MQSELILHAMRDFPYSYQVWDVLCIGIDRNFFSDMNADDVWFTTQIKCSNACISIRGAFITWWIRKHRNDHLFGNKFMSPLDLVNKYGIMLKEFRRANESHI